jgi:hypothetical protein
MKIFNAFRSKKQGLPAPGDPSATTGEFYPVNPEMNNNISAYGSKGLDAVYAFLQNDYESRGYNDALINPDESYKSDNIRLFHHDFKILIDRSLSFYDDQLKDIEFHITSRSRAGLIDLVDELRMRKVMISEHREKLIELKEETKNGNGSTERIALSYQRGFMRGLSAISQSKVFNRNMKNDE